MNCRRCNTPIPSRSASCPNCGQHVGSGESFIDDPGQSGVQDEPQSGPLLAPSTLGDSSHAGIEPEEEELSLEDAVSPEELERSRSNEASGSSQPRPEPSTRPSAARSKKKGARKKTAARKPKPVSRAPSLPPATSSTGRHGPASGAMLPDPATVRSILAQQPELIEPGLEVLTDEAGQEVGIQHATEVGVIDLLARDAAGNLVAVMVMGPDAGSDLVAEALHRLGWVRKHLAKDGEEVRGVVLTDHLDEQVAYAAAAVAGTLRFKGYALSLSLVDLEI